MVFFRCRVQKPDSTVLEMMSAIASQMGQSIKRQHAEETLHQLIAGVELSSDAIVNTTLNGIVISWNAGAEKMYGYSAEEAKGQDFGHLVKTNHKDIANAVDKRSVCAAEFLEG